MQNNCNPESLSFLHKLAPVRPAWPKFVFTNKLCHADIESMKNDRFFQENNIVDQISSIFDDLPGFTFFIKDIQLRYVAFNQRLELLFNVEDGSEILGKRDRDFMPAHIVKDIQSDDLKVLKTGVSILNHIELVPCGKGFVDWSTTNKKPLRNDQGEICGVMGVTRPFSQSTTSLQKNSELESALKLMHQSYRENISITKLAQSAHLSLSTFQRKFKACFNMTPKQYIRHLKVQEACHQMTQSTISFAEISYACGFSDQSHFSREFTRIMKVPPSAYRSRFKAN